MKYPKINLKEVRQQARQFQAEHPRLLLVFLLPSILLILSSFIRPLSLLDERILDQSFLSFLGTTIQSALFPIAVGFTSSIILAGALYTTINLFRISEMDLSFKDSLSLLDNRFFTQTFLTLLLKRFYLFLWSIPNLFGVYLLFYSSAMARKFVELHPEFPSVDVTNPDIEHFLLTFALYFFGSVLVMILGTIIYLPQYYAYSQVELLLCDTLAIGIAKPSHVLHTSRFLMKGYKFQRFVLDLQLLPWYILIWISFGIASISTFPFIYSSQIFFYQRLLEIKRKKV
ncbi:beta-carotene 15,15'-monooxygenase [Streptococcus sp. HMSC34B10]|uniref:DUF975 family protein n=1 Tax=Streptococcus sp. HMSC34B10 TaxID=1608856 RepID=UPI0008A9D280|nr:DUF975 family protein [Streptococcus sp. HMSC34B10]OHS87835.1 beta-carotene 15,15'-monooxygenase [Streptococcus sp. HMSC34B10]